MEGERSSLGPGSNCEVSRRRLIINADDFGASSEINRAVILAHQEGVLTSASLIVTGPATAEAVQLARQNPTLAVGLHLVLAKGRAASPKRLIPHLVDDQGRFPDSCVGTGIRQFCLRSYRREVRSELLAQFERFAATGLELSHVDGHLHYHVHPAVFPEVVRLAVEFGARGIRVPAGGVTTWIRREPMRAARRLGWAAAFRLLDHWCQKHVAPTSLSSARPSLGLLHTGDLNEQRLLDLMASVTSSLSEIYLHPTVGERVHRLGANRAELDALLSPNVRRWIAEHRLELTSYRDLEEHQNS
jgi:chitin disaccharide deacetylase